MDREREIHGEAGEDWTDYEVQVTVAAFMRMREMEIRGERYVKAAVLRETHELIPSRTTGAISMKFSNINSVLSDHGHAWLDGYKPLPNRQGILEPTVLKALRESHRVKEAEAAYLSSSLVAPLKRRVSTEDLLVPVPGTAAARRARSSVALTGEATSALSDFRTKALGDAGEELVLDCERESLIRSGRPDLADRVDWVARTRGDGFGYDVLSFKPDGRERLIEVKTTNLGPMTPFYITRWEVEVSREHAADYSLYRVHGFARDPRIYVLDGNIEERARLDPKVFLGIPI